MHTMENTRVVICRKGGDNGHLLMLPHPKSSKSCLFCLRDSVLLEVQKVKQRRGSWIIENNVKKDGSYLLMAPVDPLFVLLPHLEVAASHGTFQLLSDVLISEEFPALSLLQRCDDLSEQIENICEMRNASGMKYIRFSKEKTLSWLKQKVVFVANELSLEDAIVKRFGISSAVDTEDDEEEKMKKFVAFKLVSEYVPVELEKELADIMNINVDAKKKKRKRKTEEKTDSRKKAKKATKQKNVVPQKATLHAFFKSK